LYAATGGVVAYRNLPRGVYKSVDGGNSWSALNTGLSAGSADWVNAVAIDPFTPTTLYAGGRSVLKSTDAGGSWSGTAELTASKIAVSFLTIDPLTPTTLYAGSHQGLFKSTDGGETWSSSSRGLIGWEYLMTLAIDPHAPDNFYLGTAGSDYPSLYRSTDAGRTWLMGFSPCFCPVRSLVIAPTTPSTLYSLGTGWPPVAAVFRRWNSAVGWGAPVLKAGRTAETLVVDPQTPTTVYAGMWGAGGGAFKSTDGGDTWSAVNAGLTNLNLLAFAIDPQTPDTLYAGTDGGGAFKSTDGGASWMAASSGLAGTSVRALAVDPTTPTTVYAGTEAGVFMSEDGGGSWGAFNAGLSDLGVRKLLASPGASEDDRTSVYLVMDSGEAFVLADEERDFKSARDPSEPNDASEGRTLVN
jgi:photosystem II stability/assembly factor-like uncharacterized protein